MATISYCDKNISYTPKYDLGVPTTFAMALELQEFRPPNSDQTSIPETVALLGHNQQ